ncbi:hypothetical protein [Roseibium litorale]|uniref:Sulfotransferase family protein n=1 Tax=Roseibium litorale TaxID=2803841 RepID=A0ABR9CP25_9HYPH|nr:hypothetical protein [Roseibium litorale]MBD8892488.1 hypothetical protein [Roseibium litorale]
MKTIFLHIGHGKTGTSATQKALMELQDTLKSRGILYPDHPSRKKALRGGTTSGNVTPELPDWFQRQILDVADACEDFGTLVFSSENMILRQNEFVDLVRARKNDLTFHFIVSVRDPIEMVQSHFNEAVKRGGYTGTILEIAERENHICHATNILNFCHSEGIRINLFNYSSHKMGISEKIMSVIDPEIRQDLALQSIRRQTVNRSLTGPELQLVRLVNHRLGNRAGSLTSTFLLSLFPSLSNRKTDLSPSVKQVVYEKLRGDVAYINQHLPAEERILY